jgi:hypothetical protein
MTSVEIPQNPVIDPVWWAKEMAALNVKLSAEFLGTPPETITAALEMASHKLALPAHIPNFLPVLVGREARALLRGRPFDSDEL